MIIKEIINGFTHTFSDQNKKIRKVGTNEIYIDAMDVLDFEYEETDIEIEQANMDELE
jgi:hypothetical protein